MSFKNFFAGVAAIAASLLVSGCGSDDLVSKEPASSNTNTQQVASGPKPDGAPCASNLDCMGGNACADELSWCVSGACESRPGQKISHAGVACDDGNFCTTSDTCASGTCSGKAVDCDDKSACTNDSCNPKVGCVHAAQVGVLCSDGDLCTSGDSCSASGACAGEKKSCDDKNPCTSDSCDSAKGCVNSPNANSCDDGNVCTEGDICASGACAAGKAKICNDSNVCTDDSCDAASGCKFTAKSDAAKVACSDKDATTKDDVCVAGECVGTAFWQCNADADCVKTAGTLCGTPYCAAGTCKVKFDLVFDDKNPCTLDGCDPEKGPTHEPLLGTPCDDGNACTESDSCAATGSCKGTAKVCDDGNACTDNKCDAATGCVFEKMSPAAVKDNKWWTKDTCDPQVGISHVPYVIKVDATAPADWNQYIPVPIVSYYVKMVGSNDWTKIQKPTKLISSYTVFAEEICPTYTSGMVTPFSLGVQAYSGTMYVVVGGEWAAIYDDDGKKLDTVGLPQEGFTPDGSLQPPDYESPGLKAYCKKLMLN